MSGDADAPRISVIMPTWRRADTIREAVDSVLAQRFDRFELIIVVDGEDDASAPIARDYAARDPRVRALVNPTRLGVARSRNRAIEAARGDLIGQVDSDDVLLPGALEEAVRFLDENRFVGLCYSDIDIIDRDGNVKRDLVQPPWPGRTEYLRGRPWATHFNVYRKAVAERVGGYTETIAHCHTQDFYRKAAERYPIRKIPKTLYRCRVDGRNTSLEGLPPSCEACESYRHCPLTAAIRKAEGWRGHVPRKVALFLTTRCNFDCSYCFTRKYKWDLDYEAVARTLVQARDHGAYLLTISGGEPTLYGRLDDVVDLAAFLGYRIGIISNGWRWPQARLEKFIAHRELAFIISLEGADAALHDHIRRKGSFAMIVELVRRIRALDPTRFVGANVIITPDNIGQMDSICDWAFAPEIGLSQLRFDRATGVDKALDNGIEVGSVTRRYLEKARELVARWGPERVMANDTSYPGQCPLYADPSFYELVVYANGKITPCCFMHNDPDMDVGSVHDDVLDITAQPNIDRVKSLVNGVLFEGWRETEARRGVFTCVECQERRVELKRSGELRKAFVRMRLGEARERLKRDVAAAVDRAFEGEGFAPDGLAGRLEQGIREAMGPALGSLRVAVAGALEATEGAQGPDVPDAPVALPPEMRKAAGPALRPLPVI